MTKPAPITVLYFAAAQTALGITSETFELPQEDPSTNKSASGFPLSGLAKYLVTRHGASGKELEKVLQISKWSVNAEMIDDSDIVWLQGGEEVAVIPPVSGG